MAQVLSSGAFCLFFVGFVSTAHAQGPVRGPSVVRKVPETVPRLALDIVNGRRFGRRILHLEDAVGGAAKTVGPHRPAKAILLVATSIDSECTDCPGHLRALEQAQKAAERAGGLVIALMLTDRQGADAVRRRFSVSKESYMVAVDAYGVVRDRLGLNRTGGAIVLRSDGSVIGDYARGTRPIGEVVAAFIAELKEKKL